MDKILTVNQFLNRLTVYYSSSFKSDYEKEVWKDCTLEEIYNPNIDYDKVFKVLIRSALNGNFIPDVKQIKDACKGCYKEGQASKWIHVKMKTPPDFGKKYGNGGNIDVFPSGWSSEKILNYYKKRFGGEGWQIMELNYA